MTDVRLIEAVKAGDLPTIATLLASGADVSQPDEQGWTALHWAAGKGEVAIVDLLLRHGADVLHVGRDQRTPYMIALAAVRVEAARLLKEAEAKAAGTHNQSPPPRQYCKAYYLKDLRQFSGWSEPQVQRQVEAAKNAAEAPHVHSLSDDDVVFLHQDLSVTRSMWHNEVVLFHQSSPAWEEFCTTVLQFKVPDDFDLLSRAPHANHSV
jgi:ankyrin repeat protein